MTTSPTVTAPRARHAAGSRPEAERSSATGGRWWWIGGAAVVAGFAYVPLLAVRPGRRHPGHQDLPLPRPDPVPQPGRVHVEPDGGPRARSPTSTSATCCRWARSSPSSTCSACPVWVAQRLWLGSILFAAGLGVLYLSRILGLRGPGPAAAALAYMLSPYFLQYAGRISVILLPWAGLPVHAGPHHRRPAPGRVARTRPLRGGRGARERHQRQLHHLRRRRARPVAPLRRGRAARVDLAARAGHGAAHRHPDPGRLPLVDGGPRGGGGLRRQRPQVHRDRPLDLGHLQPGRHHPRPRLLVLLRHRPHRPVDQRGHPLHPGHRPAGDLVRRAGPRAGGGGVRALARARLLPPPPLRGAGALGGALSRSPTRP